MSTKISGVASNAIEDGFEDFGEEPTDEETEPVKEIETVSIDEESEPVLDEYYDEDEFIDIHSFLPAIGFNDKTTKEIIEKLDFKRASIKNILPIVQKMNPSDGNTSFFIQIIKMKKLIIKQAA